MRRFRTDAFGMHDDPAGDWMHHAEFDLEVAKRERRIAELEAAIAQRDCRIARLERELKYALGVAALHGPAQDRVAELESQVVGLTEEVEAWIKVWRDEREMLADIGRQLGGQIPEQLVSEVVRERMAEITDLIHPHDLAAYRTKKSLHK